MGRSVGPAASPHLVAAALAAADRGQVASDAPQQMFPLREAGADTHFVIHTRVCTCDSLACQNRHKRPVFLLSAEIKNTANADQGNEVPPEDKTRPRPARGRGGRHAFGIVIMWSGFAKRLKLTWIAAASGPGSFGSPGACWVLFLPSH